MPSLISPTSSHFHPYQVTDSRWPTSLYPQYSYACAQGGYWVPESRPRTRTRRYSVGSAHPASDYAPHGVDIASLNKALYHRDVSRQTKPRRERAGSRSQTHEAHYTIPHTPWMQTVPLPPDDSTCALHSRRTSHSHISSIDSAGSWSPDASFLQGYAALPECRYPAPAKVSVGPVLIPELAKDNRLKWDVRNLPAGASFPPLNAAPGLAFVRPDLNVPALSTDIRNVSISFDGPHSEVFRKDWGCIIVRAKSKPLKDADPRSGSITVFDLVDAIYKYFHQQLSAKEIAKVSDTSEKEELLKRTGAARLVYTGHSKEGDRYRRVDLLDEFRFRSLKVDTMSGNWCHLHLRLR